MNCVYLPHNDFKKVLLQSINFFGLQHLKKCMTINVNLHIKMQIQAFRNTVYLDFTRGISLHRRTNCWHILFSVAFSWSLLSLRIAWYSFTRWKKNPHFIRCKSCLPENKQFQLKLQCSMPNVLQTITSTAIAGLTY